MLRIGGGGDTNEKHEIESQQLFPPVVILAAVGFVGADVVYRIAGVDSCNVGIVIERGDDHSYRRDSQLRNRVEEISVDGDEVILSGQDKLAREHLFVESHEMEVYPMLGDN